MANGVYEASFKPVGSRPQELEADGMVRLEAGIAHLAKVVGLMDERLQGRLCQLYTRKTPIDRGRQPQ